jgi:hypothetical protein
MPTDAQLKAELTRGLDQAIAEVEGNPDIPKQLRDGILKTLKEARQSGDPRDLTRLADLARGGWGDELRKAIEDQVEDALKDAGIDADLSARGGSFKIDLGKGGRSWAWNWNHDDDDDDDDGFDLDLDLDDLDFDFDVDLGSPFDDPTMGWMKKVPFLPWAVGPGSPPTSPTSPTCPTSTSTTSTLSTPARSPRSRRSRPTSASSPSRRSARSPSWASSSSAWSVAPNPNQAEIDRLVDAITAEEAKIRKARLGALTQTRKVVGK